MSEEEFDFSDIEFDRKIVQEMFAKLLAARPMPEALPSDVVRAAFYPENFYKPQIKGLGDE